MKKNVKHVGLILLFSVAGSFAAENTSACPEGTVVSSISYEGLEHTKSRVVDRELLNRVGEPFSAEKFEAEKRRLQDLDLFTEIEVSCRPSSSSEFQIPNSELVYRFKEIFRWIPSPSSKTTERDGLMLGPAFANLNVLGEDIRAEIQYRTSTKHFLENNEYAFYASSPYLFALPLGWNFEFSHTDSHDDIRDYHDNSWLWDLDLDYKFLPHLSILGTVVGRSLKNAAFLPEFGAGFAFDFRDSKLDSRKGFYYEYMLTHVGGTEAYSCEKDCLGSENYWELLTDARAYFSMWRLVTGATALVRYRPGDVKFYDYFSHGGVNSYRGRYGDSERLGVHETLLNLEERFVLLDRQPASIAGVNFFYGVQLVAGFDGSLIWNSGHPGWENYEGAVYGGAHLVVPAIDRIRFEVGYSPDRGEPKYFFGIIEKVSTSRWRGR